MNVFEKPLNDAWSGKPTPSVRATYYLGVMEALLAAKSCPGEIVGMATLAGICASESTAEFKRSAWWKKALKLV